MASLTADNPESDSGRGYANPEEDITSGDWFLLATAIDHLGFIGYCIIFAFIIISSYV